jgi:hypothetical protein
MEEFLLSICLLKILENGNLNKNIIIEGQEILEDIKK